jgi:hypothetical protein
MRTLVYLIISCGLLAGCASHESGPDYSNTKPGYYGGDGSSQEKAVLAVGVEQSAYAWIAQKYPGSKILDQALVVPPGKKRYDLYRVRKRDGKVIQVWFLISGGIDALINGSQ